MFIRIGIWKTRNTDDSLGSGTELLLPSLSLGFSTPGERERERDTHNFSMLTVRQLSTHWPNQRARTPPQSTNCTGLAQVWKINWLRLSTNLNSLLLFKITKNPSPSLPDMTSFISPVSFSYLGFLLWHLWLSHPPRTCVNTCVNVCT